MRTLKGREESNVSVPPGLLLQDQYQCSTISWGSRPHLPSSPLGNVCLVLFCLQTWYTGAASTFLVSGRELEGRTSSVVLDLKCEGQLWFYSRLSSSSSSCVVVIWALPWVTAVRCSSGGRGHTYKPCVDWTTLRGPILMFQSLHKCRRKGSNRSWLIKQLQTIEWQLRVMNYGSMDSCSKNEILKKKIYAHILHNWSKNDDACLDYEAPCMKQISGSHVNSCQLCSLRHNDTVIEEMVLC